MRAGRLDRRITLLRRAVAAPDANGSAVQSFTDYATVWAEKIDAGGREFFAGNQEQAELAVRFRIRYRSDVLATDRITLDGLNHDITHIQELGRREGLMLFATAVRT
jgi:SPP1 family predicted phage head-tail adaptor